jgi:predicted AlkP superfamily pyrophosphatase or phosphodiesterase
MRLLLSLALSLAAFAADRNVLVVSIDGLDHRYIRDADKLGLKIPNLRRITREGQWAERGVIGVVPTVTFPSHTTLVTGVAPDKHGIINNNDSKTGERYWFSSSIKVPALWDAARAAGLRSGAVEWPVTVGAAIDFNFPEKFAARRGGNMDMAAHEEVSTPGFIDKVAAEYPSFNMAWVDDRVRTQAVLYLLRKEKVNLILVHLVDHDSEAHDHGPFTKRAVAALEFADECVGQMLGAMPKTWVLALVSDHGFERVDRHVSLKGLGPLVQPASYAAVTADAATAAALRKTNGVGREIPAAEIAKFAPQWSGKTVFEPALHVMFGETKLAKPHGEHGFWPMREDYRSVFALWGAGVKPGRLGEIEMTSIAARLAAVLGIPFPKEK